eukprot:symbB.v1.2.007505.t1/scaffold444.1/size204903/5
MDTLLRCSSPGNSIGTSTRIATCHSRSFFALAFFLAFGFMPLFKAFASCLWWQRYFQKQLLPATPSTMANLGKQDEFAHRRRHDQTSDVGCRVSVCGIGGGLR